MRLVVRLFGLEVLAIEQGDNEPDEQDVWVDLGTTTSAGFQAPELPERLGEDWGEDAT